MKKQFKKSQDAIYGGALALQSTNLLRDRSVSGLTNTAQGFVSIGITGALANQAFNMASKNYSYKKKKKK